MDGGYRKTVAGHKFTERVSSGQKIVTSVAILLQEVGFWGFEIEPTVPDSVP